MKNKKDKEKFSLKDQLNSTQIDTFQSELIKTLELINQFLNNNSKLKSAELEDIDLYHPFYLILIILILSKQFILNTKSLSNSFQKYLKIFKPIKKEFHNKNTYFIFYYELSVK